MRRQNRILSLPRPVIDYVPGQHLLRILQRPSLTLSASKQLSQRTRYLPRQTKPPHSPPQQQQPSASSHSNKDQQLLTYTRKLAQQKRQLLRRIEQSDKRLTRNLPTKQPQKTHKEIYLKVENAMLLPNIRRNHRKKIYSLNKLRSRELSMQLFTVEEEDRFALEPWNQSTN